MKKVFLALAARDDLRECIKDDDKDSLAEKLQGKWMVTGIMVEKPS